MAIKLHQLNTHHGHHAPRQLAPPAVPSAENDSGPADSTTSTTTTQRETTHTSSTSQTETSSGKSTSASSTTPTRSSTSTGSSIPERPEPTPEPVPEPVIPLPPIPTPSSIIDPITSSFTRNIAYETQTLTQDPSASGTSTSDTGGSTYENGAFYSVLYALIGIVGVAVFISVVTMAIRRNRRRRDPQEAVSFDPAALENRPGPIDTFISGSSSPFPEKSNASFVGSRRLSEVPSVLGVQEPVMRSHSRQGYPEQYEPYTPTHSVHHGHSGSIGRQSQFMAYPPQGGAAPPYAGHHANSGYDQQNWGSRA